MTMFMCDSNPVVPVETKALIGEASLQVEKEIEANEIGALCAVIASH